MSRGLLRIVLLLSCYPLRLEAQIGSFPYTENFDSGVTPPALPSGWTTSTNRLPSGDFITTTSSPRSAPNAVFSQNSTIFQFLITQRFDFTNRLPDKLQYWTSRSATHTSGVLVEASIDNGLSFPIPLSDTLRNPGNTAYNLISLNLPSSLANQSQVKFRWRIIGGVGGTTGTFRIDDISLTMKTVLDLSVQSLSISPSFPLVTDTVTFTVVVANLGIQIPSTYTVEFFDDLNRDSVGQDSERFQTLSPPPITPGDSLALQVRWSGFTAGEHQILAVVRTAGDENPGNNRGILNFLASLTPRSVVINEIMYGPTGGEPEWIEIHNTLTAAVNLRNWKISNRISSTKYSFTTSDAFLPSKGFAVITRDSVAFRAFHPSIPELLFINTSLPAALFRNDSDAVVLFDSRNLPIDSLYYKSSWGGSGGKSLERIDPLRASTEQSNWGTSLDPVGSSPGRVNTLTQKDNDLVLRSVVFTPAFPTAGGSLTLTARITNAGKNPAQNYSVSFSEDVSGDSVGQPTELLTQIPSTMLLQAGDSTTFSTQIPNLSLGDHRYIITVDYAVDEDLLNNKRIMLITVGFPPRTIVINEIMYAPSGGEPEWVEIYNLSNTSVNLRNWRVSNRITSSKYSITTTDVSLAPNGFAVVTRDSTAFHSFHPSVPSLVFYNGSLPIALFSNSGDAVVVFDSRNAPMDSLFYSPSWGGSSGRSLERIAPLAPSTDQSNWTTSLEPAGSTPGRINTITQKNHDLDLRRLTFLPSLAVAGGSLTLTANVVNVGLNPASNFAVSFFEDLDGDSVGQPTELLSRILFTGILQAGDSSTLSFEVKNISQGEHRFLSTVEYDADEGPLNNKRVVSVIVGLPVRSIVINEIMYAPTGGEPEWIELYNTTNAKVNLKNWRLSNRTTTSKYTISLTDAILRPFSYAVVTKDNSILNFYSSPPPMLLIVPSLPTALFSNSGDAVVLYDERLGTMDSLTYVPSWGGTGGRSLERIDHEATSTDSINWGTSTDAEGSTPGKQNSIATLEHDLRAFRIFSPQGQVLRPGIPIPLTFVIQNIGRQPASGYAVKIYHDANRDSTLTQEELIGTVTPAGTVQRRDSLYVQFTWQNAPSGPNRIAGVVEYSSDQRPSNNAAFTELRVGFHPRALIINEIMYAPRSGQAEWVELYNPNSYSVDLNNWVLSDMKDATGKSNIFSITKSPLQVPPGGFAVISSDSSIMTLFPSLLAPPSNVKISVLNRSSLSLSNEGDDVIITDLIGDVIDSVRYSPSWHNPDFSDVSGISLERINQNLSSNDRRNWSSCVEKVGGTPGRRNSIFTTSLPAQTTLSMSPNPFSPDGDGLEDFTVISYQLPLQVSRIQLKIFDSLGRLVRTLASHEPSGPSGQIIWDGLDDQKRRLRMGIYVVFLEAIDSSGGIIETAKIAGVIAGRL